MPPRAVDAGVPNAPVDVAPKGALDPPPNGFDVFAVFVAPNPVGLLAPNKPPPLFAAPNPVVEALLFEPNPPPKAGAVVVVPPPPNRLLLVLGVVPNPVGLAPKALLVCAPPKPVKRHDVSEGLETDLLAIFRGVLG